MLNLSLFLNRNGIRLKQVLLLIVDRLHRGADRVKNGIRDRGQLPVDNVIVIQFCILALQRLRAGDRDYVIDPAAVTIT